MALRFEPYPIRPKGNPEFSNEISQGIRQIGNTYYDARRQAMLDEYLKAKNEREQREDYFKYGRPIDPNQEVSSPTGEIGKSYFMPGGHSSPVGTGVNLKEAFAKFVGGGMQPNQFRPEFTDAMSGKQAETYQEKFDNSKNYSPEQMNALFGGDPKTVSSVFPGGVPTSAANLMGTIASREATREQTKGNQSFNNENTVQTRFLAESKDFKETATSYQRVIDSAKDPSAAGDLALIFAYMKMLDPGSTVREGEFANAENSGSIPSTLQARYNKVISGERLAQEMREDFVNRAGRIYNGQEQRHRQREEEFRRVAKGYGMDPSRIVIDLRNKQNTNPSPGSGQGNGLSPEKKSRLEELRRKQANGTLGK